jgi:archaeosine-15-forming tRNA-guanine transglycosylase
MADEVTVKNVVDLVANRLRQNEAVLVVDVKDRALLIKIGKQRFMVGIQETK